MLTNFWNGLPVIWQQRNHGLLVVLRRRLHWR